MADIERVTVTLPKDFVRDIDRREKNRSKFIAEAVRRELERRRRAELYRSLENPHPESAELAERGLDEWTRGLPDEDTEALVNSSAGKGIRWVPGEGWKPTWKPARTSAGEARTRGSGCCGVSIPRWVANNMA